MQILLIGGGFVNKGAEAMSLTVKEELSRRLGNASFLMEVRSGRLSEAYTEEAKREGIAPLDPSVPVSDRVKLLALHALREPRRAAYLARHRGQAWKTKALADSADAFVDISGYAYADKWGPKKAREMNFIVREARRQGKPYVVMPQTWGPFSNAELNTLSADACRRADLFYARDKTSRRHLADLLGKPAGSIPLSPDVALAFEPGESHGEAADRFLQSKGLDPEGERPMVGVAPNMRVFERNEGVGSNNAYAKVLIETCRACMNRGIDVLLIPHEIKPSRTKIADDRLICNIVETALRGNEKATVASQEDVMSARLTKTLVRRCDLLLGSRFHSIVAALSQAVPAVAIGWSFKYQELMGEFGMEEYVVDHDDMGEEGVEALVRKAWEEREENSAKLTELLPQVREQIGTTFDQVASALQSNGRHRA